MSKVSELPTGQLIKQKNKDGEILEQWLIVVHSAKAYVYARKLGTDDILLIPRQNVWKPVTSSLIAPEEFCHRIVWGNLKKIHHKATKQWLDAVKNKQANVIMLYTSDGWHRVWIEVEKSICEYDKVLLQNRCTIYIKRIIMTKNGYEGKICENV